MCINWTRSSITYGQIELISRRLYSCLVNLMSSRVAQFLVLLGLLAPLPLGVAIAAAAAEPALPSPEAIAALPPDGGAAYNRLIFEKSVDGFFTIEMFCESIDVTLIKCALQ